MVVERGKAALLAFPLASVLLTGCHSLNTVMNSAEETVSSSPGLCQGLRQESAWLDAAVAAESRWGLPLYVALAELDMPIGTAATAYIQPLASDWEQYRLATENWHAEVGSIATALDFLGWHAQLAVQRNHVDMRQAGELFLAYRLGHGGYYRQQNTPDLRLGAQARAVAQRAAQYREQLRDCPRIRERAGSFFRWPW